MKHLLIVGARGWGREVYAAVLSSEAYRQGLIDVKGFLDSKTDALDGLKGNYPPVISSPEAYEVQAGDVFFVAMGAPEWRRHYVEVIKGKGGRFHTVICKGAYINPTAQVGEGSFIAGWTSVSDNVRIGSHVIIHVFCDLGHDAQLGDYATIEAYGFLGGYSSVGENSIMHVHSTLIRHKHIGSNVEVGAGSVVMRNVNSGLHIHGNPAKRIEF